MAIDPIDQRARLTELARLFLKLGTIGFGGPAAHIAMMEDEVVRRRAWLTREEFLDLVSASNLIPGPNSTELAIHIGHRRAGFPGLVTAGACFILPAMLMVMGCGWMYLRWGKLPPLEAVLQGVKPVIIAIVLQALWGLARSAIKSGLLAGVALVAAALAFWGVNELALLFGAGLVVALAHRVRPGSTRLPALIFPLTWAQPTLAAAATTAATGGVAASFGLWPLFWFFLKVGSVLYGSGYVLLAFLRSGLVERLGWLTETQLLDAVAVGQITPGPVFTTATFVGYLLGGAPAALVATLGIFLPAFFFVAVSAGLVARIRRSPAAGAFLDGVNAASLALMAAVTLQLARAAVVDWFTLALAAGAAILLLRCRVNSSWLVAGGALAGALRMLLG
jgi:chromate transporter